jgi:hypothetical protein
MTPGLATVKRRLSDIRPERALRSAAVVSVQLIIDLVESGKGRRRAERTAELPGVPAAGDHVWVVKMLALKVAGVSWEPLTSSVMVFLTRADANPDSVIDHDGELELTQQWIDALGEAGWTIEDF